MFWRNHVVVCFVCFGCGIRSAVLLSHFFIMSALKRFAPLLDRVLVQRLTAESTTKGGILIPEKAQGKVHEGVVRAVGPGALRDDGNRTPMSVNVGDRVFLPEYGGTKVTLDDEEFTLFRDGDLLAKISEQS